MTLPDTVRVGLLATLMVVAGQVQAQDDIKIATQRLSDTVSVLFGEGGNIGLSTGPDGVFIIDDGFAEYSDKLRAAIARISNQPIRYVINTHWHFDHAGGNEYFGKAGSIIIAHDNARKRLKSGAYLETHDVDVEPAPDEALQVLTFNDTITLHLNGEAAEVHYVKPAHTDGDAFVWFRDSNVIHTGDLFLNGVYPLVDYSSGGTIDGSIAAIDTLLAIIDDQTRIIPGHGPVGDKMDLQAFRDMCETLRDRVAVMKERGMSIEEVIAAPPTTDFDDRWNTWGDGWRAISLRSIYGALP
jgi:cyclase